MSDPAKTIHAAVDLIRIARERGGTIHVIYDGEMYRVTVEKLHNPSHALGPVAYVDGDEEDPYMWQ